MKTFSLEGVLAITKKSCTFKLTGVVGLHREPFLWAKGPHKSIYDVMYMKGIAENGVIVL